MTLRDMDGRVGSREVARLGHGDLVSSIRQAADMVAAGVLDIDGEWPLALLGRWVSDLGTRLRSLRERPGFGEVLARDVLAADELAPIVRLPAAHRLFEAIAGSDPSGGLTLVAQALRGRDDELGFLVAHGLVSAATADRRRLEPPPVRGWSRRRRQRLARLEAELWRPWPEGRGRTPGSLGRARDERIAWLVTYLGQMPEATRRQVIRQPRSPAIVTTFACWRGVSAATARRDLATAKARVADNARRLAGA